MKRWIAPKGGPLRFLFVCLLWTSILPLWARNGQHVEIQVERIAIPAPTIYEVQRGLSPRQRVLVQKGEPGLRLVTWAVRKEKGRTVRRTLHDVLVKPPQPTMYRVGIGGSISSRGGFRTRDTFVTRRVLQMKASAYDPGPRSCGRSADGRTAIGWPAGYGLVAVDPKVIPMGTLLYIEGYGMAIAADRGRAIKGMRIDLGFPSYREAKRFGRKNVKVHILGW